MDDGTRVWLALGASALCAIIGIYYIWVRKLSKAERDAANARLDSIQQNNM